MKLNNYQALLISIVVPGLIILFGVQSSYWLSSLRANSGLIEIVSLFIAIFIGAYTFSQIKINSKAKLVTAWVIYLLALGNIIFWVGLITACNNGDCL